MNARLARIGVLGGAAVTLAGFYILIIGIWFDKTHIDPISITLTCVGGVAAMFALTQIGPAWTQLKPPLNIFLERDSDSDQYGIQTFPTITYVQISVTASSNLERCRAWITNIYYRPTDFEPFALEHNERLPCSWSKHGGGNEFEIDIKTHDPPIRINIAIYNKDGIAIEQGTPTNLLPKLQRIGVHRFSISVVYYQNGKDVVQKKNLVVKWCGMGTAFVLLENA